jgi:hypothetical protein
MAGTITRLSDFPPNTKKGRSAMLKTTLYGAVAGGLLAAATVASPVIAAPAAPTAPQVEKNVNDVQHRHRHWRRHHHHHHDHYGYYYAPRPYYYAPGPGIYVRPW